MEKGGPEARAKKGPHQTRPLCSILVICMLPRRQLLLAMVECSYSRGLMRGCGGA